MVMYVGLIYSFRMLQVWSVKLGALFEEQNVGVLLGSMSLLLGIVSRNYQGYESVVPKVRGVQHTELPVQ